AHERQGVGERDLHQHAHLHGTRTLAPLHVRDHTNGIAEIGEPESEIEERDTEIEEGTAASLRATETPSLRRPLKSIITGANAGDLAQLTAPHESVEALDVGPKSVVVGDEDHLSGALRRRENPLDAARVEREWPLAQYTHLR